MMRKVLPLIAAAVLCGISAVPALADQGGIPNQNASDTAFEHARGAPGPVAAAGLPFLLAAGAVGLYRTIRGRREKGE